MTEMVERAAAAIHAAQQAAMERANETGVLDQRELDRIAARAAIEAMREPTEAMVDAGAYELLEVDHDEAERAYRAMIDAALNPGDRT